MTTPAFPIQRTWVVGEIVTAAYMNANVRDSVTFALKMPAVQAYNSAGFTVANGAWVKLPLDQEHHDKDPNGLSAHSPTVNNSRLTANYPALYKLRVFATFAANATGSRYVMLRDSAGGVATAGTFIAQNTRPALVGGNPTRVDLEAEWQTSHYVEAFVFQDSGAIGGLPIVTGPNQTGLSMQLMSGL